MAEEASLTQIDPIYSGPPETNTTLIVPERSFASTEDEKLMMRQTTSLTDGRKYSRVFRGAGNEEMKILERTFELGTRPEYR